MVNTDSELVLWKKVKEKHGPKLCHMNRRNWLQKSTIFIKDVPFALWANELI
jgi:hypothetical protein